MTDFFKAPEVGELFDEVQFVEQSEEEAKRTIEGYHREGKRNRDRGEEPQHKRQRYDHDRRDGGRYGGRRDSGKYGMFQDVFYFCIMCLALRGCSLFLPQVGTQDMFIWLIFYSPTLLTIKIIVP